MSVRGDVELLRQVPLFAPVEFAQLQLLVFSSRRLELEAGQLLLRRGRSEEGGLLVLEGEAEALGESGEPVARIGPGAFLGELQMIARLPATIDVKALSDMRLLNIDHDLFMRVCREFPEAGGKMLAVLTRKFDASLKDLRAVQRLFEPPKPTGRTPPGG